MGNDARGEGRVSRGRDKTIEVNCSMKENEPKRKTYSKTFKGC